MTETSPPDPSEVLITSGTAANILGVSIPTVHRWTNEGQLTVKAHVSERGDRRYSLADVQRLARKLARKAG